MTQNPFFETWTTPFGLPPFDRIEPRHFPPALERGMEEERAAIEAIAADPAPPSFQNTIEALERSGRLLRRVAAVFFNLCGSHTNDALESVARDYAPRLARHRMAIAHNAALFERIAALHEVRDALAVAPDAMRLLERRYRDFVRQGALLDSEKKARLGAIAQRLAALETRFGQNVLHDEEGFALLLDEEDLDGLPDFIRAAAARAAGERGAAGRFLIPLSRSAVEPFLSFSTRRDLREKLYEAWTERGAHAGEWDNRPIIREILALRADKARLLGFPSFAGYRLDDTMAKTPEAVLGLLDAVWEPAERKAEEERAELESLARADGLNALAPSDWHYYAEKVRQRRFDLREADLKPYFALDNVVRAAFAVAGRLFGLRFVERRGWPLYHPDVRIYEVEEAGGRTIGIFLHDNFARPGKRSGAWMGSYRVAESFDGEVLPIVVNNNNFSRGNPAVLSFDDAKTLFHEFGHALHGLLSRARYPSQSGTAVQRDFVEFPSQILEHWIAQPEVLRQFARHCETGEPMPEGLLARLAAARHFNQGFLTVEYTAAALFDLALHHEAPDPSLDIDRFEAELREKIGAPAEIALRHRPAHFQHLFAGEGYAAGYYAYLWAEVLDADGFAAFKERGDIFDPSLAARLRAILEAGDTQEPMALYRAFRGREPQIAPLLEGRGLAPAKGSAGW
jgi:peptidyl-dipeptidase Dcp